MPNRGGSFLLCKEVSVTLSYTVHAALLRRGVSLQTPLQTVAAPAAGAQSDMKEVLEALVADKKKKEKPKLEVAAKLAKLNLGRLDHDQWPLQKEADELLEAVEKQRARGVKFPCPYADLRRFAPAWCASLAEQKETQATTTR